MALFIAIAAYHFTYIMYHSALTILIIVFFLIDFTRLSWISSSSQNKAFLTLFVLLSILVSVFFLSCPVLVDDLELLEQSKIVGIDYNLEP